MLTWEPYRKSEREESVLPDILAGKYDQRITAFALAAKSSGGPILLRWGHEPNGDWYSWSGYKNGASLYIGAFRRVRMLFRKAGADNVKFVFSVNHQDVPDVAGNRFESYYPGADAVDIVGIDAYNWGDMKPWGWVSPTRLLDKPYRRAVAAFPDKPLMLSEIGCCSSGGDKNMWVRKFFAVLPVRFPAIKAFVWFDLKKECDWSLTLDPALSEAYQPPLSSPYFRVAAADFIKMLEGENEQEGPAAKN